MDSEPFIAKVIIYSTSHLDISFPLLLKFLLLCYKSSTNTHFAQKM